MKQNADHSASILASSGIALGSRRIASSEIDRAFGMTEGKLRLRAGIEFVAHVTEGESELTLGAKAACGVALHMLLQSSSTRALGHRGPIFLASLGPGLLFGGGWADSFLNSSCLKGVDL